MPNYWSKNNRNYVTHIYQVDKSAQSLGFTCVIIETNNILVVLEKLGSTVVVFST